jgi:hypothetical protein
MRNKIIAVSPFILVVALVGDFVVTFALGLFYAGYSHIHMVMSELGSSQSPVALWMSLYWVFYGLALIVFGYSFIQVYRQAPAGAITAFLLILIGNGNGLCSAFPMDSAGAEATLFGKIHDIGSGIGFLLMFALPFLLLRFFTGKENQGTRIFLVDVQVFVVAISVFLLALAPVGESGLSIYVGLWQRLYLASYYLVFILLARKMMVENVIFERRILKGET